MKTKIRNSFGWLCAIAVSLLCLSACDEDIWSLNDKAEGTFRAESPDPIATYLNSQEDFSEWVNVLNYADYYGTLNQGSNVKFTLFAPNNAALAAFYAERGVASIEDLGVEYAQSLVKQHVIDSDSIKITEKFSSATQEYLAYTNVFGEELRIYVDTVNVGYSLNNIAHISSDYVATSNGFIYEIDALTLPLVETTTDRVNEDGAYSIMAAALQATGYDAILNTLADTVVELGKQQITKRRYTFLNVTDATFATAGITNLSSLQDALATRYQATPSYDATVTTDSLLKQYVEYHLLDGIYTVADLEAMIGEDTLRIWNTLAPNQILMVTQHSSITATPAAGTPEGEPGEGDTEGDGMVYDTTYSIGINEADIATVIVAERNGKAVSDISARNGIIHEVSTWLPVYEPTPATVVWDLADNAKIRAKAGIDYRPAEYVSSEAKYDIRDCFEEMEESASGRGSSSYYALTYATCRSNLKGCLYNDRVVFNMGYQGYVTMKTPTLVRGKYRVTITVAYMTSENFIRTSNGTKGGMMKVAVDGGDPYIVSPYTKVAKNTPGACEVPFIDEIEFTETSSHLFKFIIMDPAASTNSKFCLQFDVITFTPIDD